MNRTVTFTVPLDAKELTELSLVLAVMAESLVSNRGSTPKYPPAVENDKLSELEPVPEVMQTPQEDSVPPPVPTSGFSSNGVRIPWDARIHSGTPTLNKGDVWRTKRGVDKETLAQVEAELEAKATGAEPKIEVAAYPSQIPTDIPAAPTPPVPAAPTPPVLSPSIPAAPTPPVLSPSIPAAPTPPVPAAPTPPVPAASTPPVPTIVKGFDDALKSDPYPTFIRLLVFQPELKAAAEEILSQSGLTLSTVSNNVEKIFETVNILREAGHVF